MKNLVTRMLSFGIVLAGTVALHAQTVTATVPFNFYMGRTAMPKGAYKVDEVNGGAAIMLRTGKTAQSITVHDVAGKSLREPARLVFQRYGDTYFLSEIWTGRSGLGRELARTSHEKELRAGLPAPPNPVIVTLVQ